MRAPVVVVGAGLAGLTTALRLAPEPVIVLTAGTLAGTDLRREAASGWAQGGIAAAVGAGDSPYLHALDTLAAGDGLCDPGVVEAITQAGPLAIEWLAGLGARFDADARGYRLGLEGAHSRNRIVHASGDGTGAEVLRAVVAKVRATASIRVVEHARLLRLNTVDGSVHGVEVAVGGRIELLPSGRVVLATGGIGGLFANTTNPLGSFGVGLALAARAGARLRDLEMVQFHPTALAVGVDPMPLVSEAVRGEGAVLVTADGQPIMDDPLVTRDVVARAVAAVRSRGDGVFLDARGALGDRFAGHFPAITRSCLAAGVDPAKKLIPVTPAAHYHMGGVAVDGRGRTSVPGLWAVGEVASTGLHGANRLASNSLLEAVVAGGWAAADLATAPAGTSLAAGPALGPIPSGRPDTALRQTMDAHVGVLRSGAELRSLADRLSDRLGAQPGDDPALIALLVTLSALRRTESRGAQARTDFPDKAPAAEHQLVGLTDALAAPVAA